MIRPPKPKSREAKVSLWRYVRLFRKDILSAQPERLYRAKMAVMRTPFFWSFMINQTELVETVLKKRPEDFPKSRRFAEGVSPLLGQSVFNTNGKTWARQRRIIDPAFEHGRLKDSFDTVCDAARAASDRLDQGSIDVEPFTSHAAADIIFRALFSIPIDAPDAELIYQEFQDYQSTQPLLNLAAFLPLPGWLPRFHRRKTKQSARRLRALILRLTKARADKIAAGNAPDDLCTKIMTYSDPETGEKFSAEEMVDQVAIFLLAGHETSASAVAWSLYLLALSPETQSALRKEAQEFWAAPAFSKLSDFKETRAVFRETMRLYPPVPMMVRESTQPEVFRDRKVPTGSQIVISPWHLHRNDRYWPDPDAFCPERFNDPEQRDAVRSAFLPFSAGPRVCPGAGFAMMEACLLISRILADWDVSPVEGHIPQPSAYLTVRSANGIHLRFWSRA
ncbi:cytochrome P450 [Actibacterium pelagium]|uniref:Cytochrome P450 n=1 Tax=Actibacterium pelagium TaxID=2029103 RepID=A0A917EJI1_9RHOB|nr:cytochrome P450 [Actibacterium pelagium]GGE43444.1 cytochrome P450 [Actibacterium pelagium]